MAFDLKVYVVTHKEVSVPGDPVYALIQAGAKLNISLGTLSDDVGDHISEKNPYFCEMTAHYWVWKNTNSDLVGIVHYRRHFSAHQYGIPYSGKSIAAGKDLAISLQTNNLILSEPWIFYHKGSHIAQSVEQQYVLYHGFDIFVARQVVSRLASDYLPAFDFVMRNNRLVGFNMMVARREIFDSYSAWIFDILFALESAIPLSSLKGYQARVMGFLAERLFTVWIVHNRHLLRFDYRNHVFFENL